ncbi:glycoside hydrolase family 88 protein [Persicobacter psychrovividus]|uniref:Glycoside hydrolase family 88 protein n=1 Tax=Persicobacter psychrovividus TaxID=387638 RepID=A0ABN6LK47_9BACT|nr:hypothetical protein PEPS_46290 [Persicobacter psychrovividus]
MRKSLIFNLVLCLIIGSSFTNKKIKPETVKVQMQQVANWQIVHFKDLYSGREKAHHPRDWTNAAFYVGLSAYAKMADTDTYFRWLKDVAEQQKYTLHWRKYMADDLAVGQMYFSLYDKYGDKEMIAPTQKRFDWIMANPSKEPITLDNYKHMQRWTWCDALFMAPPVLAELARVTQNETYTKFMMSEYEATKAHLFDTEEHLFYRDNSFIGKEKNGKKIFWSRGNGWVFAGLCLIMDQYEEGSKAHQYFKKLYLEMAPKVAQLQMKNGLWAMSLLDSKNYPQKETSGSGFFTYGLAWGINHGYLDKATYEPVVKKAWLGLGKCINKDGMLSFVQPIGAAPGESSADQTEVYGSGAFLLAGSEVFKLYNDKSSL